MNKKCPKCSKQYDELSNYCTKCGVVPELAYLEENALMRRVARLAKGAAEIIPR